MNSPTHGPAFHMEQPDAPSFWDPDVVIVGPGYRMKAEPIDFGLPPRDVSDLPPPVRHHLYEAIRVGLLAMSMGYQPPLH